MGPRGQSPAKPSHALFLPLLGLFGQGGRGHLGSCCERARSSELGSNHSGRRTRGSGAMHANVTVSAVAMARNDLKRDRAVTFVAARNAKNSGTAKTPAAGGQGAPRGAPPTTPAATSRWVTPPHP